MPNVEEARKRREAEAYKRDEVQRAERKRIADKERERENKEHEKRRITDAASHKQEEKRLAEIAEGEMKSLQARAEMGDQKAIRELEERKKGAGGPRPYTGSID
ncbi:MAG TPA: hypothetical protein V6C81_23445 [Planktothrix sp.]|jgi:hypothetical protein